MQSQRFLKQATIDISIEALENSLTPFREEKEPCEVKPVRSALDKLKEFRSTKPKWADARTDAKKLDKPHSTLAIDSKEQEEKEKVYTHEADFSDPEEEEQQLSVDFEKERDAIQPIRRLLGEPLLLKSAETSESLKALANTAQAVIIALTKYWPLNKEFSKPEGHETYAAVCRVCRKQTISIDRNSSEEVSQNPTPLTFNGFLVCTSCLKKSIEGKDTPKNPTNLSILTERELYYYSSYLNINRGPVPAIANLQMPQAQIEDEVQVEFEGSRGWRVGEFVGLAIFSSLYFTHRSLILSVTNLILALPATASVALFILFEIALVVAGLVIIIVAAAAGAYCDNLIKSWRISRQQTPANRPPVDAQPAAEPIIQPDHSNPEIEKLLTGIYRRKQVLQQAEIELSSRPKLTFPSLNNNMPNKPPGANTASIMQNIGAQPAKRRTRLILSPEQEQIKLSAKRRRPRRAWLNKKNHRMPQAPSATPAPAHPLPRKAPRAT